MCIITELTNGIDTKQAPINDIAGPFNSRSQNEQKDGDKIEQENQT